jgi:hypothetical protein
MSIALLVAGIGAILAGLVAIIIGVPVKEFSFGNTMILTGVIGVCTGMMMLALWMVVAELKIIARRLALQRAAPEPRPRPSLPPLAAPAPPSQPSTEDGYSFSRDQPLPPEPRTAAAPAAPLPWQEQVRERGRQGTPEPATDETASADKPRRNLLFSSTSRRERERATRSETEASDPRSAQQSETPSPDTGEAPPASFENSWPRTERARPPETLLPRRTARFGSTAPPASAPAEPAPPPVPEHQAVTVLKSGVVDGMAYSLYSDGSIEAQMPEGMMRFASIDELRAHLDQRQ